MDKDKIAAVYHQAKDRLLLLDYDGVLAPIVPLPENAVPSKQTRRILEKLASDPGTTCIVISGRPRETLEEWLGDLPLSFVAEHGLWRREVGSDWRVARQVPTEWKREIKAELRRYADALPGSFIEEKYAGVVLHYRNVTLNEGSDLMQKLLNELQPVAARLHLTVLSGKKVIEVIPQGIDKGTASKFWLDAKKWDFILGAGDDKTDEDLFSVLPAAAYSIKVGDGETLARQRVHSQPEFMSVLEALL